jgi:esterase
MILNYKTQGSGPPILILHGLFGMLDNWKSIANQLETDYSVYLLDLRNHGRSPHDGDHSYTAMAEDIREFMESQYMYSAYIIGHSMGGKVAMQFAYEYPDMVEKMIIVDIAPKTYTGGHEAIIDALLAIPIDAVQSRTEVEDRLSPKIKNQSERAFLMKNLTRKKEGGFAWKMNLEVLSKDYSQIMRNTNFEHPIEVPTCFIRGGNSRYIEDKDETTIGQFFSQSSIVTIEDAGHWVHADKPQELLDIIKAYF